MRKFSSRETVILIVTVALAAVFVVFRWIIQPALDGGGVDLTDQLRAQRVALIKASQIAAQKPQAEAKWRQLEDMVGRNGSEETQIPDIVSTIETAARQVNIHITNIQPQRSLTEKGMKFLSVELEVDGPWPALVQFIDALQQQSGLYFVDELNVEKYSGEAQTLRGRLVVSRMCLEK